MLMLVHYVQHPLSSDKSNVNRAASTPATTIPWRSSAPQPAMSSAQPATSSSSILRRSARPTNPPSRFSPSHYNKPNPSVSAVHCDDGDGMSATSSEQQNHDQYEHEQHACL